MSEFFFLLFLMGALPILGGGVTLLVAGGSRLRRAGIALAVAFCMYVGLRFALPYVWQAVHSESDSVRLFQLPAK